MRRKKESDPKLFFQALNIIYCYKNTKIDNWDNIDYLNIHYHDQEINILFYWYIEQEPIVDVLAHYISKELKK